MRADFFACTIIEPRTFSGGPTRMFPAEVSTDSAVASPGSTAISSTEVTPDPKWTDSEQPPRARDQARVR